MISYRAKMKAAKEALEKCCVDEKITLTGEETNAELCTKINTRLKLIT